MTSLEITTAAPMTTVQDGGRFGQLRHGIAASGPMDRSAWHRAGNLLARPATSCLEFGAGRLRFRVRIGQIRAAFCGGAFNLSVNKVAYDWESVLELEEGDHVEITPGASGNFGLVRFDREIDVPLVLKSRATNLIAGIGGLQGRVLREGDMLEFARENPSMPASKTVLAPPTPHEAISVVWSIHADMFDPQTRRAFLQSAFAISSKLDRMGIRLLDNSNVFLDLPPLSLVSDVVVPGDIQILGDGTPIVLMRDHQPTGGYPRIATVIAPDLDRLAQMRPGAGVRFSSVSVDRAHSSLRSGNSA